jgi:hypothetical protein
LRIFCNLCNKGFNFDDLPTNTPIFCPDCGSPATIIDASELLQNKNSSIDSSITSEADTIAKTGQVEPLRIKRTKPYTPPVTNQASTTAKTGQVDPSRTKGTKPYSRPKYNRRTAFVLTSLGVIGIVGVGHIFTKTTKGKNRGICFLIGGFFVYLFTIIPLDTYIFHPSAEYPDPSGGGKFGAIFFLVVFILIWLWQFLDLMKLTKSSPQ